MPRTRPVGAIAGTAKGPEGATAASARVCVLGTTICVNSDAGGRFRIEGLRGGEYALEILGCADAPLTTNPVQVRAGVERTIAVALPARLEESVTVSAPAFRLPDAVKTSGVLAQPREILKSASALQDVSRYVQTLPGVVIGATAIATI